MNTEVMDQINARYAFLRDGRPVCTVCGEEHQVWLVDTGIPAQWKCRTCKCKFTYEPKGQP